MDQGFHRILCPRCRVNNFPGKTHCWQCGAPLPPPEAVKQPVASPITPYLSPGASSGDTPLPPGQPSPYPAYSPPAPNAQLPASGFSALYPTGATYRRQSGRRRLVVPVVLALITLGGVFIAAFRARTQRMSSEMETLKRILYQQRQTLQREMNAADSGAPEFDSLDAQAQREIRRLSGQLEGYGLNAPVSPDGRVHLRGGGSISPEQWERARGALTAPP